MYEWASWTGNQTQNFLHLPRVTCSTFGFVSTVLFYSPSSGTGHLALPDCRDVRRDLAQCLQECGTHALPSDLSTLACRSTSPSSSISICVAKTIPMTEHCREKQHSKFNIWSAAGCWFLEPKGF